MNTSGTSALSPAVKKKFGIDFIIFALVTLAVWIIMLYVVKHSISYHSYYDEHTRQALAWKQGNISLPRNIDSLEIAHYKNRYYVSFPPVPTFIEFPFVLIFNSRTPNTFVLLLFTWMGMLLAYFILLKLTESRIVSYLMSFSFFWGSTVLYLSLEGAVWHQGQLYGLFFGILSLFILLYARNRYWLMAGAFSLALSVGCRPYYLAMAPFYIYHSYKQFPGLKTIVLCLIGLAPPGIFYAVYNFIRFDSLFEFGHKYLPWYQENPHGQLVLGNFGNNLYFALINPPEWDRAKGLLSFNGMGTGLWFSSPVILLGFGFFFRYLFVLFIRLIRKADDSNSLKKVFRKYLPMADDRTSLAEILLSFGTIGLIWFLLLLHDTNGWFQFGYRFSVDLIPLLIFFFGKTFRKPYVFLIPVCQFAIIVNIYGALWYYVLKG